MPKIFEYLGILVFFYSREHEPIHVHARKGELESKAEFIISDGKVLEIRITTVKGVRPLSGNTMTDFKKFLEVYADIIVARWVDYFVYHKDVPFERITKKLP